MILLPLIITLVVMTIGWILNGLTFQPTHKIGYSIMMIGSFLVIFSLIFYMIKFIIFFYQIFQFIS